MTIEKGDRVSRFKCALRMARIQWFYNNGTRKKASRWHDKGVNRLMFVTFVGCQFNTTTAIKRERERISNTNYSRESLEIYFDVIKCEKIAHYHRLFIIIYFVHLFFALAPKTETIFSLDEQPLNSIKIIGKISALIYFEKSNALWERPASSLKNITETIYHDGRKLTSWCTPSI